jgi:hypothetical protein
MTYTSTAGEGINVDLSLVPDWTEDDVIDAFSEEVFDGSADDGQVQNVTSLVKRPAPEVTPEPGPVFASAPLTVVPDGTPAPAPVYDMDDPIQALRAEVDAKVADMEWRLAQVYEQKLRMLTGGAPVDMVTVEDINDGVHRLTGYTLTQNSPVGGGTWASLHIVLKGVDFTIADGSITSANKYAWFVRSTAVVNGSTGTATLVVGNSVPVLAPDDALIFVNNGGVITSALEASMPAALPAGIVTNASLAADLSARLTQFQTDITAAQNSADGSVTTYFASNPPWPAGAPAPSGAANREVGDVWYEADAPGGAFRWSGTAGTPTANTWVKIADTDTSALAALVNTKVTTYVATFAAGPVVPAGGFVEGDLWMVTDQGNKFKRRQSGAWVDITLGDAALATGISASKISGELAVANIPVIDLTAKTTGNIPVGRVPSGVAGANLANATNALSSSTQIGNGIVVPQKINSNVHMMY